MSRRRIKRKKICVFTGNRAEYDLLYPLLDRLKKDSSLKLQLVVSGAHLSPEFASTERFIVRDGFRIDERVEMLLASNTSVGIVKSTGVGMIGYADALDRLSPDLVVLLGDRFETFAFATSAYLMRVPIMHLYGGEVSLGSLDDGLRNAITQLADYHCVSTQRAKERVIAMGKDPERVWVVGALGLDNIRRVKFLPRKALAKKLGLEESKHWILFTYHPPTKKADFGLEELKETLEALATREDIFLIVTQTNPDTMGARINELLTKFVRQHPKKAKFFPTLGRELYLSVMKACSCVLGNSSSGIIEAPSLKVPTVDIGERQAGRERACSVINAKPSEVNEALNKALYDEKFRSVVDKVENPYGDGTAADKIVHVVKEALSRGD